MWIGSGTRMSIQLTVCEESGVEETLNGMMTSSYAGDASVEIIPNKDPGFCHPENVKMFASVKTAVLTTDELTDCVRLVFTTMKTSIDSGIGIKEVRRQYHLVDVESMSRFRCKFRFGILHSARTQCIYHYQWSRCPLQDLKVWLHNFLEHHFHVIYHKQELYIHNTYFHFFHKKKT